MTAASRSVAPAGGANAATLVLLAVVALAGLGAALDVAPLTLGALCAVQILCLTFVAMSAAHDSHPTWTNPSFIVAMAWGALFLIPSIAYSVKPDLLDVDGLAKTVATVTTATIALTAGYFLTARSRPLRAQAERVQLAPGVVSNKAAVILYAVGVLSLGLLVMRGGGPVEYLSNLDKTAGVNAGLFYVVGASLCMRWVPIAIIAQRWGAGERPSKLVWAAFIFGTVVLTLTGSRMLLAIAMIELAMVASLVRYRIPTGRVLVTGLILGLVIIFGLGAAKRYQSAVTNGTIGGQSFATYMTSTAPREVVPAYVNNYVDGVRLIALSESLVPNHAPYETFRPIGEMLLKPIPGGLRPKLDRDPAIKEVLVPPGDTAYAIPILATAWLAGGVGALIAVSLLIGVLVRFLDNHLLAPRQLEVWKLLLLVMAVVQLPGAIRSGIPNGVAQTLTDIIGTALIAWLVVRKAPAGAADEPVAPPAPTKEPVTT